MVLVGGLIALAALPVAVWLLKRLFERALGRIEWM